MAMMDPASIGIDPITITGMVGSGIVGIASQFPKIQQLERELESVQESLTQSEQELVTKVTELEEKLFVMDAEFEETTSRFQKQYDQTQRVKMTAYRDKLQLEMKFKLDIQMAQRQSDELLQKTLPATHNRIDKQSELMGLKVKQTRLSKLNVELEQALEESVEELKRFRESAKRGAKKRFLFF